MLVYLAVSHMREDKKRYPKNVALINGDDSYAISKEEWTDNVDFWAAITYIHIGLYLLFTPSRYTREDLQNYNSLDSFQFLAGWVRELLVRRYPGDEALVMGGKRELSIYTRFYQHHWAMYTTQTS